MTVFASRKKFSKRGRFSLEVKSFSNSRNEGFPQKYVSTKPKKAFNDRSLEKIYKKWFVLARKTFSTTLNETFVEKLFSHGKKLLLLTRKSKKMVYPSRKIFFFWNCFPLIWIMASNSRKKVLNKRTFSAAILGKS